MSADNVCTGRNQRRDTAASRTVPALRRLSSSRLVPKSRDLDIGDLDVAFYDCRTPPGPAERESPRIDGYRFPRSADIRRFRTKYAVSLTQVNAPRCVRALRWAGGWQIGTHATLGDS